MRPITRSRVCPHLGSRDHRPVPPAASRQDHRILGGRNHKLGTSVRRVGQQADQFCGRDQSEQRYASGDYRHSVKLEIVDQLSGLAHGGIGVHGRDAGVDDIAHPAATHLARLAGWPPHRQGALGDHRDNSVAVADDSHRAVEVLQALPYLDHRILGGDHRHVTGHHRTYRHRANVFAEVDRVAAGLTALGIGVTGSRRERRTAQESQRGPDRPPNGPP